MVRRTDEGKHLLSIIRGDLLCVFMGFFLHPPIMDRVELINGIAMPGEITRLGHPKRIVPRTTLLQRFQ
jgi:hypothetical protein